MREGKLYTKKVQIARPRPEKELTAEMGYFP